MWLLFACFSANAATYLIGDSLSDPGSLGFTFTDPLINKSGGSISSSVTNLAGTGKVWTNYFSEIYCTAYSDPNCTNYAFAGAGVTFSSPFSNIDTSMFGQMNALPLLSKGDNVIIWIGANDLMKSAQNNGKGIDQIIATFKNNISILKRSNAKIYIMEIPALLASSPNVTSSHLSASLLSVIGQFNAAIESIKGIRFISSTAIDQCFPNDGLPQSVCQKNISPNQVCGSQNNKLATIDLNNKFLFADSIHPSSYTHNYAASCFANKGLPLH